MSTAMLTPLQTAVSALTAVAPLFVVLAVGALLGMSIRNMFESIMSEDDGDTGSDGGGDGHDERVPDERTPDERTPDEGGQRKGGTGGDDGTRDSKPQNVDSAGFGEGDTDRSGPGGARRGDGGGVELEHRLEDLETEVGTLSATMDTVREENEQIARSVADVEENVRKLLGGADDRGGNPAEVPPTGMADGDGTRPGGGERGGEGEAGRGSDAVGEMEGESASAESDDGVPAAEFFDDGVVEETLRSERDRKERSGEDTGDRTPDGSTGHEASDPAREGDGDTEEGLGHGDIGRSDKTTFAELKAEYESGELEWVDEAPDVSEARDVDADRDTDDRDTMPSFADLKEDYESGELEWVDDAPDEAGDETPTGGSEESLEAGDEDDDKTTFADLKEAYESGDIEWADDEGDQTDSEDGADQKIDEAGGTAAEVHGETEEGGIEGDDGVAEVDVLGSETKLATGDESSATLDAENDEKAEASDPEGQGDLKEDTEGGSPSADEEGSRAADEEGSQAGDEEGDAGAKAAPEERGASAAADTESPQDSPVEALTAEPDRTEEPGEDAREQSETGEPEGTVETVAERPADESAEQVEEEPARVAGTTPEAGMAPSAKPYLERLPEGYWADLVVIEWLDFLVEEVGPREAHRALEYYESIGWIDGDVRDELARYLRGFDGGGDGTLTIDHHQGSLSYINKLNGGGTGAEMLL